MENQTLTKVATWSIDPTHSEVQFKVKHLLISTVTGSFKSFEGKVKSENENFEGAEISFALDINSIDTNQEQRDAHLKSADFFDAEKYPQMTFKSTKFSKKTADSYVLEGDLTIKDVTQSVKLDVEYGGQATDFYGNTKAGFELTGKINRKEFGLTWDGITEAGTIVVSDEIKLFLNIQVALEK